MNDEESEWLVLPRDGMGEGTGTRPGSFNINGSSSKSISSRSSSNHSSSNRHQRTPDARFTPSTSMVDPMNPPGYPLARELSNAPDNPSSSNHAGRTCLAPQRFPSQEEDSYQQSSRYHMQNHGKQNASSVANALVLTGGLSLPPLTRDCATQTDDSPPPPPLNYRRLGQVDRATQTEGVVVPVNEPGYGYEFMEHPTFEPMEQEEPVKEYPFLRCDEHHVQFTCPSITRLRSLGHQFLQQLVIWYFSLRYRWSP